MIPFHYTSLDIVERGRAHQRNREYLPCDPEPVETSPARPKYRRLQSEQEEHLLETAGDLEEKSLQSVLNLAQQELELEAIERKVRHPVPLSCIRFTSNIMLPKLYLILTLNITF